MNKQIVRVQSESRGVVERIDQVAHGAPDSRRARREAELQTSTTGKPSLPSPRRAAARSRSGFGGHTSRRVGRLGVLASLALATIVLPLATGAGAAESGESGVIVAEAASDLPSTYSVLTSGRGADESSVIVSESDLLEERSALTASRSTDRAESFGCIPGPITSGNGLLSTSELCTLWDSTYQLQADAAGSFTALNDAYRARFGADLCLASSYRPLAAQRSVAARKPGLAATPGKSMHGWGLAVDICPSSYSSTAQWNWLNANGPTFGWDNPAWARRGGGGAYEPWHWEYFPIAASKY